MAKNTHTCPLSQDACDESCSWVELVNCEYHEGLVDGRAQEQVRTVCTVVQTTEDATPDPVRFCALRSFRTLKAARAFCVEHIIRRAQNYANFAWMLVSGLRQYVEDEVGKQYYVYCGQFSGDSYHLDILESKLEGA